MLESGGLSRTKSQHSSSSRGVLESPRSGGSRLVNFRSFRLSQQSTPSTVRRHNTSRPSRQVSQPAADTRSYQNIRQLSVDPRLLVQRSAPQTPLIDGGRSARSSTPANNVTPRSISPNDGPRTASPSGFSMVLKPCVRSVSMNFSNPAELQEVR